VKPCMWSRRTRASCVDSEEMPQLPRKHRPCLILVAPPFNPKVNQSLTPVPIHCLFTAYSLPIHCLFTAYSLPIHCSNVESRFFPRQVWEFHLFAASSLDSRRFSQRPVVQFLNNSMMWYFRNLPLLLIDVAHCSADTGPRPSSASCRNQAVVQPPSSSHSFTQAASPRC
jgi:hypothetical protein